MSNTPGQEGQSVRLRPRVLLQRADVEDHLLHFILRDAILVGGHDRSVAGSNLCIGNIDRFADVLIVEGHRIAALDVHALSIFPCKRGKLRPFNVATRATIHREECLSDLNHRT